MKARYNRRRFLVLTGTSSVGLLVLSDARSARSYVANEKLNMAVIGAGGRGAANLDEVNGENIVALCDVDERRAANAFKTYAKAAKYHDYRKLLDELENRIDAVVVSTPNHVHVPASVTAMRMGKHAYCEKPLAHSVAEARLAARTAAEKNVATQMGTQIHATDNYRRIVELIRGGAIGAIRECHCWLRGGGSAGDRPQDTPPVPTGLHWDLWLGHSPLSTLPSLLCSPRLALLVGFWRRRFWQHGLPLSRSGLLGPGTALPDVRSAADGPPPHPESTPAWQHVRYSFPATGDAHPKSC